MSSITKIKNGSFNHVFMWGNASLFFTVLLLTYYEGSMFLETPLFAGHWNPNEIIFNYVSVMWSLKGFVMKSRNLRNQSSKPAVGTDTSGSPRQEDCKFGASRCVWLKSYLSKEVNGSWRRFSPSCGPPALCQFFPACWAGRGFCNK